MSLLGDILGWIDSGRAANSISNADIAAEHGVLNAVQQGQAGVTGASSAGQANVNSALDFAGDRTGEASAFANGVYGDTLNRATTATAPYMQAGAQGTAALENYAASNPQFSFNLNDYFNSPAYKFQLDQGNQQITNAMSAQGLGSSGAAGKELTQFGQGLASTYYNQAFNQALNTFQTNQNTTLQNLSALINTGEFGTAQYNNANTTIGTQQVNTNTNLNEFLSQLGLQGQEFNSSTGMQGATENARLGLTGSELAGNYAVNAGIAHAGGILGQGNNLTQGASDVSSLLMALLGGG